MKKKLLILFFCLSYWMLPAQLVTTVAGQIEIPGNADGEAFSATFNNPHGIAVDKNGTVYTADRWSHIIRKITIDGMVSTLAGSPGESGATDGPASTATFNEPWGLCVDEQGNVYVADTRNNKIRKITPEGMVSTIAGSGNFGTSNGLGTNATFGNPTGIEIDAAGNLYIADHLTHIIRKIDPAGMVSTLAGKPYQTGAIDGAGNEASFNRPYGLTLDLDGNILVADEWNHKIRRISPGGTVSTIAGNGNQGSTDGTPLEATFNYPWDMTVDSFGNIYVADGYNYTIRQITPTGMVTAYAGSTAVSGANDGVGTNATFSGATAIALSPLTEELYIGDAYNHLVRKITALNQGVSLSLLSGDHVICKGEFIQLNAYPNVYSTYNFYLDNQLVQSGSSTVFQTNEIDTGNHVLQVIANHNSETYTSNIIDLQTVQAATPTITPVGSTTFYEGDSVILIASNGVDYFWSTGETTATITVFTAGAYQVEVTDEETCVGVSDTTEVVLLTDPVAPVVSVEGATRLCVGESVALHSSEADNYQWLKDGWPIAGAAGSSLEVNSTGIYQVQSSDANGTVLISEPVEVEVLLPFELDFTVSATTGTTSDVFQFQVLGEGLSAVVWDFGNAQTSSDWNPTYQYDAEGLYSVSVAGLNEEGCRDTVEQVDYILVKNVAGAEQEPEAENADAEDLFVPTAFTPNGDGENDVLFVRGGLVGEMNFMIFNQWGELIFETFTADRGWDGTHLEQRVQNGTYVYVLEYVDGVGKQKTLSGHVTVIR